MLSFSLSSPPPNNPPINASGVTIIANWPNAASAGIAAIPAIASKLNPPAIPINPAATLNSAGPIKNNVPIFSVNKVNTVAKPLTIESITTGIISKAFIKTLPITVANPTTICPIAYIAGDAINNAAPIANKIGIAGAAAAPKAPNPAPAAAKPPPAAAPVVATADCDVANVALAAACPAVAAVLENFATVFAPIPTVSAIQAPTLAACLPSQLFAK